MMQSPSTRTRPPRLRLWLLLGVLALTALACEVFGMPMMGGQDVPADLDTAATKLSEQGVFKVSYTPDPGSVPVNEIHRWRLHVETAGGQPVEGAEIGVDGDMPQHGHGMPTQPRVTEELGGGDYLVDGMKFQMGGWWVMDFTITAGGQTDTVHFNMLLEN